MFFTFFNLYKWYQIAQSITYSFTKVWLTFGRLKPIISEKIATQSKISKNRITLIPYRFLYFLRHLVVKGVISNTFQKSLQNILKKDPLENLPYVLWVLPMRRINYCKPQRTRCHPNQSEKNWHREVVFSCEAFVKYISRNYYLLKTDCVPAWSQSKFGKQWFRAKIYFKNYKRKLSLKNIPTQKQGLFSHVLKKNLTENWTFYSASITHKSVN